MSSGSLRFRLQQQLGIPVRESVHADLSARTRRQPALSELAEWSRDGEFLNFHYRDPYLLALSRCPGPEHPARARHLEQLCRALQAEAGKGVEPDLRTLWLLVEAWDYWSREGARPALAKRARSQAWRRADQIYAREALAGEAERLRGFPRLAQLTGILGALPPLDP